MSVYVEIPGIGTVEAKNAATEATLREILSALGGSKGGGGKGGAGGGGAGAAAAAAVSKSGNVLTSTYKKLDKAAFRTLGMFGKVAQGGLLVSQKFADVGSASAKLIDDFANVGDSITGAAGAVSGALNKIPIVGGLVSTVFTAVAGAVEKTTGAYQNAAAAGASFTGSVGDFSRAASAAGMTMENFGALVRANGEGMLGLGTTVEEGAKRFSSVSKQLRQTSGDLYALGYSTKEINEGLANFSKLTRMQGRAGQLTNDQLASGAKKYLKEMDALAKITGQERSAKEKERESLVADGMFRAAMAGLGPEVESSALQMIQSMPTKELQDFAKDLIANGTATTENSRALMPHFSGLARQLQAMHGQTQKNVAISKEQMNQAMNTGRIEGPANLKRIKIAAAADESLHGVAASTAAFGRVQKDAILQADKEQSESARRTDEQNKKTEEAKQKLAEFSNTFSMFLAQSGILDALMTTFEGLATVIQKVVVPVFNFFADGIKSAVKFVSDLFSGSDVTEGFGKILTSIKTLMGTVSDLFGNLMTAIDWQGIFKTVTDVGKKIFDTVNSILIDFAPIFETIVEVGQKLFTQLAPIFNDIMDIIKIISAVVAPVLGPIVSAIGEILGGFFSMFGGIIKIIKGILTGDLKTVGEGIKGVIGGFFDRFVGILKLLGNLIAGPVKAVWNLLTGKGSMTAEEKKAEQAKENQKKLEQQKAAAIASGNKEEQARLARLEKQRADLKKHKDEEAKAEQKKAADAKKAAEDAKKSSETVVDYNDSLSILRGELAKTTKPPGATISPPTAGAGGPPAAGGLGGLSSKFEAGNRGSSAVGWDSTGGTSYGKYQIASKTGTMKQFMEFLKTNNPEAYERLSKAGPADAGKDGAFAKEWQALAASGKLGTSEHDFIKKTHFDVGMSGLKNKNLKGMIGNSKALQEVMWSTSVQHGGGGASGIFDKVYKEGMSEQDLIKAIYKERGTKFGKSSAGVQQSVQKRFAEEQQLALGMTGQSIAPNGTQVASAVAKEEQAQGAGEGKQGKKPSSSTGTPPAGTQESAETLLASLNTKMDQLIRLNHNIGRLNERQLNVQQGLTNNLFVGV